jgi:hypothetical protein
MSKLTIITWLVGAESPRRGSRYSRGAVHRELAVVEGHLDGSSSGVGFQSIEQPSSTKLCGGPSICTCTAIRVRKVRVIDRSRLD